MEIKYSQETILSKEENRFIGEYFIYIFKKLKGNCSLSLVFYFVKKSLHKCFDLVTFESLSFKNAILNVEKNSLIVKTLTHRNYMGF